MFFVVQAIAQGNTTRPYSLTTNLISDLGNTACGRDLCSPLHGLMNATFVLVGLLHAAGAITTWRAWPRYLGSTVGLGLLALAGASLFVVGLAPENERLTVHTIGGYVGLLTLNVAMIALGATLWNAARWLSVLARVAGILGLVGFGLFVGHSGFPIGIAERITDYPSAAMVVVFGVFLLVAAARSKRHSFRRT